MVLIKCGYRSQKYMFVETIFMVQNKNMVVRITEYLYFAIYPIF
jgi:hypothetical protein